MFFELMNGNIYQDRDYVGSEIREDFGDFCNDISMGFYDNFFMFFRIQVRCINL